MRKITLFAVTITLLCSCAGWQKTSWRTVDLAQKTSEALAKSALVAFNQQCEAEVRECEENVDPECERYWACDNKRLAFYNTFRWIQIACIDTEAALVIAENTGDNGDALAAVADIVKLLAKMRQQLREGGVLLW